MAERDDLDAAALTQLLTLSRGYMASRVFLTAVELGLFEAVGSGRCSAAEAAARIDADPRATEILLNALVGLGLFDRRDGRFGVLPQIARLLVPDAEGAPRVDFRYAVRLWSAWSDLTRIVKSGQPYAWEKGPDLAEQTALAMRTYALAQAEALVNAVDCTNVTRLLDLGGGTGAHAITFVRRHPTLEAVVFDSNAAALALAQRETRRLGLAGRVRTVQGDFLVDDLGGPYNLALLSSVCCLLDEAENRSLLGRVRACLTQRGRVAIHDALVDETLARPAAAALFAVHMLVATPHGRAWSAGQVSDWLTGAGFTSVRRIPLGRSELLIAQA